VSHVAHTLIRKARGLRYRRRFSARKADKVERLFWRAMATVEDDDCLVTGNCASQGLTSGGSEKALASPTADDS
jgi:hypothetical protein